MNLSKAFDMTEHSILLKKLELYGIRGSALSWFESYLTNRTLRVKCRTISNCSKSVSKEQLVEYGTPQGSCLGPLIFLIFVNDLHLHLKDSECIQFADDTTLVFTHKNLNYLWFSIENKLSVIQDRFIANKLTLNMDKSVYLLYHNHNQNILSFNIKLNGTVIPRVKEAKLLGVWLDDKLKWDTHTNKLLSKLKCGIGMLKRSKNLLSKKAKKLLYFGQIHSNLCYSLCIWGSMLQSSMLRKLANAQNKAVKLIDPILDRDEIFRKHKILKFDDMIKVEQCKLGYKLCHNLLPKALANNMDWKKTFQLVPNVEGKTHTGHEANRQPQDRQLISMLLQLNLNCHPVQRTVLYYQPYHPHHLRKPTTHYQAYQLNKVFLIWF